MNHKHDYQLFKNTNNETEHFDHASVIRLPVGYGTELRHLAQLRVGTNLPQRGRNQVPNVLTCPMPKRTTTVVYFQFSECLKQKNQLETFVTN